MFAASAALCGRPFVVAPSSRAGEVARRAAITPTAAAARVSSVLRSAAARADCTTLRVSIRSPVCTAATASLVGGGHHLTMRGAATSGLAPRIRTRVLGSGERTAGGGGRLLTVTTVAADADLPESSSISKSSGLEGRVGTLLPIHVILQDQVHMTEQNKTPLMARMTPGIFHVTNRVTPGSE
jgi:hypothetical protein